MKNKFLIFTNIALAFLCLFFIYRWLDAIFLINDIKSSDDMNSNRTTALILLLENDWKGMSKQAFEKKLEAAKANYPEKIDYFTQNDDGSLIVVNGTLFEIKNGYLFKIHRD